MSVKHAKKNKGCVSDVGPRPHPDSGAKNPRPLSVIGWNTTGRYRCNLQGGGGWGPLSSGVGGIGVTYRVTVR